MAEAILVNMAADILTKLSSVVLNEVGQWWGINGELEKLRRTVSMVQAVLLDAEERHLESNSNQVREWLGHLRQVVYEADDLLDEISSKALRRKTKINPSDMITNPVCLCFFSSGQLLYSPRIARSIVDIRDRLAEVAGNRDFILVDRPVEKHVVIKDRDQTHSSPPEVVVGREGDKKSVIELVMSSHHDGNLSVIPIVGIGGLGKTTLAQLVFNDPKVVASFDLRLWVCVSDNFDVKLIIEKMLESATREKPQRLEMDPLKDMLHEKINSKRFLLVLDDVWSNDHERWSRLKDLLVGGANGSRIIVTTRLRMVARMTRAASVHELQGLSSAESWELFKQMAFPRGIVPSEGHEKTGMDIVLRCYGVPLAIKAIGRLLYFKDSIGEWESFKDMELARVGQAAANDILPILRLSYDHLPLHLKRCFAYCQLFPKEHVIHVPTLINLWMAQGFIKPADSTECLEDVGFDYFMDLLARSLFQDPEKDECGNVVTCKMHDLIHDLAAQVSGEEFVVSDLEGKTANGKVRHLSIFLDPYSPWKVPPHMLEAADLRTFLLLNEPQQSFHSRNKMEEGQCSVIFASFQRLRVLDLHSLSLSRVPPSIGKLRHLRYIDLSENDEIKVLPESITELYNLQVLRLDKCTSLEKLPKDIQSLANLSQLGLSRCYSLTHMPPGLGRLTSLHTLSRFVVAKFGGSRSKPGCMLDELGGLNSLRGQLEICNLKYVKNAASSCKAANLKAKSHLQTLLLDWSRGDFREDGIADEDEQALEALEPHRNLKRLQVMDYRGQTFPNWLPSLTNILAITIFRCKNLRHLPPLHRLPYLKRLKIEGLNSLEYVDSGKFQESVGNAGSSSTSAPVFFPSLESLQLWDCSNLKGWAKEESSLSSPLSTTTTSINGFLQFHLLSDLAIGYCPNMVSVPPFPPLKSMALWDVDMNSLVAMLQITTLEEQPVALDSSILHPLSRSLSHLQYLQIGCVKDLKFFPLDLLQNLSSLKTLLVSDCPRLVNLDQALQHLTSLEELWIWHCKNLVLLDDDNGDQPNSLKRLRCLFLRDIPKMESLPRWIQHNSTLRELYIWECSGVAAAPEWMNKLTYLQHLSIHKCPQLSPRCGSNVGEDWPNIAHVSNIKVDDRIIQHKGTYRL